VRSKRTSSNDGALIRRLDPNWAKRVPDEACSVMRFDRPLRFMRLDLKDEDVETALTAEFRLGEEPKALFIYGNKNLVAFDFSGRRVRPVTYVIETSRARNSQSGKRKLLSLVPGTPGSFSINPGHIFDACDAVVAIDTNTSAVPLEGRTVSVLGVAVAERYALRYPKLIRISARYAAEFHDLALPREKTGWAIALKELYDCDILKPERRVAVIVDAFASELGEFNKGAEIVNG
jgi:hypothetical protein